MLHLLKLLIFEKISTKTSYRCAIITQKAQNCIRPLILLDKKSSIYLRHTNLGEVISTLFTCKLCKWPFFYNIIFFFLYCRHIDLLIYFFQQDLKSNLYDFKKLLFLYVFWCLYLQLLSSRLLYVIYFI